MIKQTSLQSIVIVLVCLFSVSVASAGKTVKVFLLAGQSNMVGSAPAKDLKSPYNTPHKKVLTWNPKAKKFVPLEAASINGRGRFGPEIAFGHAIAEALANENIVLIKYAASGTALYNDWSPTADKGGKQYKTFMSTVKAALANLKASGIKYEIAGMLWLQGESDAAEKRGAEYEKNIVAFIKHMREQFKTPKMPFIMARVLNHYGGKSGQAKLVRDAQVKVAKGSKTVACFDTDDCPLMDPVKNKGHYNGEGLITIGKRFAKAYTEIVGEAKK